VNPLKALIDTFEKLITEHGSATILRDHIGLLKQQAAALEKQNSSLEAENATLRAQHENDEAIINQLHKDNKELNDFIHARPVIVESDFDVFKK
jgi:hypothetical protein